jgi:hypothetical protein
VHLNLLGHLTHGAWFGTPTDDEADDRFNWFEVLNARDRRSYVVRQLEAAAGLPSPSTTPETTRRSIGPRVLARFAASAALTTKRWSIVNGFLDTSYDADVRTKYFEAFPGARLEPLRGDLLGQPAYRYWFVVDHRDRPQAVVDAERGLAWSFGDTGPGVDLLSRYRAARAARPSTTWSGRSCHRSSEHMHAQHGHEMAGLSAPITSPWSCVSWQLAAAAPIVVASGRDHRSRNLTRRRHRT